jgi:hypothetical protein
VVGLPQPVFKSCYFSCFFAFAKNWHTIDNRYREFKKLIVYETSVGKISEEG